MNYLKIVFLIALALVLTGCMKTTTGHSAYGEVAFYQAQQAAAAKPLFSMECPETGCVIKSLTVNNPNQGAVQALEVKDPTTAVVRELGSLARTVISTGTLGYVAGVGIRNARGDNITTTTTTNESTTTTTSGDTFGSGTNIIGGDYINDSNNPSTITEVP